MRSTFLVDSGSDADIVGERSMLINSRPYVVNMAAANSSLLRITHIGTLRMVVRTLKGEQVLEIENVLYSPDIGSNVLSIGHEAAPTILGKDRAVYRRSGLDVVAERVGKRYFVFGDPIRHVNTVASTIDRSYRWHRILGHPNDEDLRDFLHSIGKGSLFRRTQRNCDECQMSKSRRIIIPHESASGIMRSPGDVIYVDIFDPEAGRSLGGGKYIIGFIDGETRYADVFVMRAKGDATRILEEFLSTTKIPIRKGRTIMQTDNDAVFRAKSFQKVLKDNEITMRCSAPYTPAENGAIETYWRPLRHAMTVLLHEMNVPMEYWALAARHANYLLNIMTRKSLNGDSPYQLVTRETPHAIQDLYTFGSTVFMHLHEQQKRRLFTQGRLKLRPNAVRGVYVGYQPLNRCHMVWIPELRQIYESAHVTIRDAVSFFVSDGNAVRSHEEDELRSAPALPAPVTYDGL